MKEFDKESQDPIPGGFHDDTLDEVEQRNRIVEEAAREYKQIWQRKDKYIAERITSGAISPKYAELLQSITASTTEPAPSVLHKVKAADALKDTLKGTRFGTEKVAYIGSGFDWHFPVALGARNIEMVDMAYEHDQNKPRLVESVKKFAPDAIIDDVNDEIVFSVNLGNGDEEVRLNMVGVDIGAYTPTGALGGVLEILGPTKGYTSEIVLPNVASHLSKDAVILNFDHVRTQGAEGIEHISAGEEHMYKVLDTTLLIQSAQKGFDTYPKSPSLAELRAHLRNVSEKEE